MGNVLRVLGIIAISMVLSLTALFLILFTICGGFQTEDGYYALPVVAVTGGIFVGGVALIVWLGRGVQTAARRAAAATAQPGALAVPPAAASPAYYPGPGAPIASAAPGAIAAPVATPVGPLAGGDLQLLNVLRAAMGLLAFLPIAMMAFTFPTYQHLTPGLGIYMAVQAVLYALPPAILTIVLFRNPPPGLGLDATAGFGLGSIVFRTLFFGYTIFATTGLSAANNMGMLFIRLGMFTLLEMGIVALALLVRKRLGPMNPGALVLAVFAFLCWEGLLQALMSALVRLIY